MLKNFAVIGLSTLAMTTAFAAQSKSTTLPVAKPVVKTVSAPVFYHPEPNLPFSEAVQVGNTLYLSGHIGIVEGSKVIAGGTGAETRQTLTNIFDTLKQHGYAPKDLVKCSAMLKNMGDYGEFNKAYLSMMTAPYPARSVFGVTDLALGANVEIECIAAK